MPFQALFRTRRDEPYLCVLVYVCVCVCVEGCGLKQRKTALGARNANSRRDSPGCSDSDSGTDISRASLRVALAIA